MAAIPTVHLNGTSGQDLRREYQTAYRAVKFAIDSLCETTCNGRDYYPQGNEAYTQAYAERQTALCKLRDVQSYLEEVLMGVMDQL